MFFVDKLKSWYGEDVEFQSIKLSEDTAIFLVDLEDKVEVARVFQVGGSKQISIDSAITKGDPFAMMGELGSLIFNKYNWI